MGLCISSESTSQALATAKLILDDGKMMEFRYPVKVGYVLQKNPMCFICDSDDMDFDDAVSAISADEELELGHIYFALPLSWLRQPLRPEEMAALAVKASSALMGRGGGGGGGCGRRNVDIIVDEKFRVRGGYGGDTVDFDGGRRRGRNGDGHGGGGSSGRRRKCYAAELSTIEE